MSEWVYSRQADHFRLSQYGTINPQKRNRKASSCSFFGLACMNTAGDEQEWKA